MLKADQYLFNCIQLSFSFLFNNLFTSFFSSFLKNRKWNKDKIKVKSINFLEKITEIIIRKLFKFYYYKYQHVRCTTVKLIVLISNVKKKNCIHNFCLFYWCINFVLNHHRHQCLVLSINFSGCLLRKVVKITSKKSWLITFT